jgi:sugar/nucleoside kinase (ribokinase family)
MSTGNTKRSIIAVGSPIVDMLAQVSEEHVASIPGEKGGMELVDPEAMEALLEGIDGTLTRAAGGSAANTIFALAHMGVSAAILGKLGTDHEGAYYKDEFRRVGGDLHSFRAAEGVPTARCLSLITPDSERTMRTDLGAAATLSPEDHCHLEGYLLFNRDLMEAVLKAAKAAGCQVSLDFGSFEVVNASKDILPRLLGEGVDILFANEEEAEAYTGKSDPEEALKELSGACPTVAVKIGAKGAWLCRDGQTVHVPAAEVSNVLDTTGAGDFWAAGFLYGIMQGFDLESCGRLGAVLGGEVVQHIGAYLAPLSWDHVNESIARLGAPAG